MTKTVCSAGCALRVDDAQSCGSGANKLVTEDKILNIFDDNTENNYVFF